MRVAGSGVERTAAGQSLPARRRARGSGESRGTERDRRPLSGSGEAGRESARREPRRLGSRVARRFSRRRACRRRSHATDDGRTIPHLSLGGNSGEIRGCDVEGGRRSRIGTRVSGGSPARTNGDSTEISGVGRKFSV
jgi:hypothetical protein